MENSNLNYKDIILLAAKEIAEKHGITKINIRSVAKNSDIAIGTVYNYFPSKGELLAAVIENFWDDAFSNVQWESFMHSSFYDNLEKLYNILYIYLNKFKENWLEQLSLLSVQEKQFGKQRQDEYFKKVSNRIITLMDMDNNLDTYPWSNEMSKEKMSEFIFQNMLMMLRKGEKDMCFFIGVLNKVLSQ